MSNDHIKNGDSNLPFSPAEGVQEEGLLQIGLHHRWTILVTMFLFLVAAFVYILKATPIYTSTSRVIVEQSGPKIIGDNDGFIARTSTYLYTQQVVLKSSLVVNEVLADDSDINRYRTFNNVDNVSAFLKNSLAVSVGKRDDVISISFDSPYPVEAAGIVNAVVDSYIKYHSTTKQTIVSKVLNILQKEKVNRDKELSDKYKEVVEFTRNNGVLPFDNQGQNVVFQKLIALSDALTEAQLMTVNAWADYESVKTVADDPLKVKQFAAAIPTSSIRVLVNDTETQLESELREAEVELSNAGYHVTKNHPAVKALHDKYDYIKGDLDKELRKFSDAYIDVIKQRWETAKQKEQTLQEAFDDQRIASQELGVKAAEYSMLQSELKRAERICEIVDDRIKELNVTEDTGALNISILEIAHPAEHPSRPKKAKILAMALVFGFVFGGGLALVRDWTDVRIRSADEISAVLGIPILGVVPSMEEDGTNSNRSRMLGFKSILDACRKMQETLSGIVRSRQKTAGLASLRSDDRMTDLEKQGVIARGQKVCLDPKSTIAEAYRTIRTAVFFGAPKSEAKTILITSPDAADGKSTLASNLAITMAQAGQKTLILDADFRKPKQHHIFDFENDKGLSNVLTGHDSLETVIRVGPVKDLDIISCGPEMPNPSEILNSNDFVEILKELSNRYDRIIIDSPPVGLVSDSQILSAICNLSLLVLRAEKSTRKHSQQARDALLSVGGRLLGAVINDVPRSKSRYGYYSNYGYHAD